MGDRRIRLLMTAHDFGGGLAIAEVYEVARLDPRFELHLAVDGPAAGLFSKRGFPFEHVTLERVVNLSEAKRLLCDANAILARILPDAILTASSGPKAGLDEAIVYQAGVTPTFTIQDYWGDVNPVLGRNAETYFVIDDLAERISKARGIRKTVTVGSVKHARYRSLEIEQRAEQFRSGEGVGGQTKILVLFGQPYWHINGYAATLSALGVAAGNLSSPMSCFYRPHPNESAQDAVRARDLLNEDGGVWRVSRPGPVEDCLAAADLVCSVNSSSGYDKIVMSRFASKEGGVAFYLLFDSELRELLVQQTGLDHVPPTADGLAMHVTDKAGLQDSLERALSDRLRFVLWNRARKRVPDPADAPKLLLAHLAASVENAKVG